ncbi:hypothetical protein [Gilvibacter sp.]|uniref:hypothetical protein n=1 Tax=Gilvibacter sp. TaxID=2729997 RepID=UPI0035BE1D07
MFKRLLFISLVFILSCESGGLTEYYEPEVVVEEILEEVDLEPIEFPEADAGTMAVLIDGTLYEFSASQVRGQNLPQCGMPLKLQVSGTQNLGGGQELVFNLLMIDAAEGTFLIEELPWEICFGPGARVAGLRVSVFYMDAAGDFDRVFLTDPEIGSTGYLEITSFEYVVQWSELEDGFISAKFDVLAHRTYPDTAAIIPMRIVGTINNIPIEFPGCASGFC